MIHRAISVQLRREGSGAEQEERKRAPERHRHRPAPPSRTRNGARAPIDGQGAKERGLVLRNSHREQSTCRFTAAPRRDSILARNFSKIVTGWGWDSISASCPN